VSRAALHELGVADLGRALAARELSSVELTAHLLERFAGHERLGTALVIDAEGALAQARAADRRRAEGDAGPLVGVPIAHKDIFVTRAQPTTAGSRMLEGYRSPFDATVVARLADAGTVTLGKLNCDEFAMGSSTENSAYHPTLNPWDESRVPGGSSGGSAAAVAAPVAAGGDRHRHRRLDPPAGELLRHHRDQADLRRLLALRDDRVRVEPRPGRRAGEKRRGLRARARRDERVRRARFDERRAAGAGFPRDARQGRGRARPRRGRSRACGSGCRRSSFPRRSPAMSSRRCAPRSPSWPSSAPCSSTSSCRAPSSRSRSTT
jgi:hypothetical protein